MQAVFYKKSAHLMYFKHLWRIKRFKHLGSHQLITTPTIERMHRKSKKSLSALGWVDLIAIIETPASSVGQVSMCFRMHGKRILSTRPQEVRVKEVRIVSHLLATLPQELKVKEERPVSHLFNFQLQLNRINEIWSEWDLMICNPEMGLGRG